MFVLFEYFKVKIWQELEFRNAFEILSCVPTRWTWIAQNWTRKSLHSVAFISQILYCLRRAKLWNFAKFYKTFSIFKNISFAKYCESWFGLKKFPKIEENKNIFEATRLYCTMYIGFILYPLYLLSYFNYTFCSLLVFSSLFYFTIFLVIYSISRMAFYPLLQNAPLSGTGECVDDEEEQRARWR